MYTTCLECGKECRTYELDVNSECWMCQARFENKMRKVMKNVDKTVKSVSYFDFLSSKLQKTLMNEVVNLYKIEFKNKTLLKDHLNEKYQLKLTTNVFNRMTSPEHLAKFGLNWKFELQKLSRIK